MYNFWFLVNKDKIIIKLANFNESVYELKVIKWLKHITVLPYCSFAQNYNKYILRFSFIENKKHLSDFLLYDDSLRMCEYTGIKVPLTEIYALRSIFDVPYRLHARSALISSGLFPHALWKNYKA